MTSSHCQVLDWAIQREFAHVGVAPAAAETPARLLDPAGRDAGLDFFKLLNNFLHFLRSVGKSNLKGALGHGHLLERVGHLGEGIMQVVSLIVIWE